MSSTPGKARIWSSSRGVVCVLSGRSRIRALLTVCPPHSSIAPTTFVNGGAADPPGPGPHVGDIADTASSALCRKCILTFMFMWWASACHEGVSLPVFIGERLPVAFAINEYIKHMLITLSVVGNEAVQCVVVELFWPSLAPLREPSSGMSQHACRPLPCAPRWSAIASDAWLAPPSTTRSRHSRPQL